MATPINQTRSVKYDPVPFATTATADSLQQHESITPSTRCCPRRPKHVSGSECALIGLLENILAPLWVFARFGDVPSAWTVAGGALLLATLIGHEVAAREPVRVSQPGARGYRTVNNL